MEPAIRERNNILYYFKLLLNIHYSFLNILVPSLSKIWTKYLTSY